MEMIKIIEGDDPRAARTANKGKGHEENVPVLKRSEGQENREERGGSGRAVYTKADISRGLSRGYERQRVCVFGMGLAFRRAVKNTQAVHPGNCLSPVEMRRNDK